MHGTIEHPDLAQPWAGEIGISDYTTVAVSGRAYGQARFTLPRSHGLITDTTLQSLAGFSLTIKAATIQPWQGVQLDDPGQDGNRWNLTCVQIGQLLKQITVPTGKVHTFTNVPAGLIARRALELSLPAYPAVPLVAGAFSEAPPLVESVTFDGQSLDSLFTDLMDRSGQEYEITEAGAVNWIATTGDLYEPVLTEGYDFILESFQEQEQPPVVRVFVTDQRGYTAEVFAPEHAGNLRARVMRERRDTASSAETNSVADALLAAGRLPRSLARIGLLPAGGTLAITIPGGGGVPTLYNAALYDVDTYDASGGFADLSAEYPIVNAPHWAIRCGDLVRLIAPSAGLRGNTGLYRVRSITFGDAHAYPVLDLVGIPHWTAETLPVARAGTPSYVPKPAFELLWVQSQRSQGGAIDTARLASQLNPAQIPALSEITGTATAAQVPALQDLSGAATAAQMPSGGVVADAAAAPTQAEFNALTAALRTAGVID